MQYTFTNKDKVRSKSLGWVSITNTSNAPNQGVHIKGRGNNSVLTTVGSMPMKSGSADNDASFAMGRRDFVKTVSSSPMTMNNTDQSSYLARRKALATGKIIQSAPISFSSKERNTVLSSLRKSRNKGYVVPKNVTFSRTIKDLEIDPIYKPPKSCTGITSITIPSGVTTIGQGALQNCTSLTSVTIPSSVTTLGQRIFYQCTNLTTVIFEEPCQITSISGSVFDGCTSLSYINIPSSVTSIGNSAFSGSGLTSIIIPAKVTSIASAAFHNCTSLTTVTFDEGSLINSIGSGAFANCTALKEITFTSSTIPSTISSSTFPPTSQGIKAYYTQNLSQTDIATLITTFGDGNVFSALPSTLLATYNKGETIIFNTSGSGFDTELGLFDENGNLVASNDDGGGLPNGASKIDYTFNSVGKYYLVVGGYDLMFAQDFGITIGHTTRTGSGKLSFGKNGEQLSFMFFTITSDNKYVVYSFDIVEA